MANGKWQMADLFEDEDENEDEDDGGGACGFGCRA
jgi:hypothetical protein